MKAAALAVALALAGCTTNPAAVPLSCPSGKQQPVIVATLFFGRTIQGRAPLTDAEWADFTAAEVTPRFPGGFTAMDGDGQWRDPNTGHVARERAKILVIATAPVQDLGSRLGAVMDGYTARFHQRSVGLLTERACGVF